ncbi:hypothetical protein DRE_00712 [Drechslerella stenobrocha 248]|uniref:Uncharacterized protein n=1 Tax=Drechslerella stenobrocha 248 TaxID=1043628 RepID=W7HZD5_9PEZI|nr:hypothetical protein DRE_00712 [Drechslerella stenobrocha 248]
MSSIPPANLLPLRAPLLSQPYDRKQISLSIPNIHRRAVLDRLQEISLIFQQQYSAGRIAPVPIAVDKPKSRAAALDLQRSTASGTIIARRIAVRKLATRFPLSPSKALYHARRLQLFGRNRNRGASALRGMVLGLGAPDPLADLILHNFWSTVATATMTKPTLLLGSTPADESTTTVEFRLPDTPPSNTADTIYRANELVELSAPLLSSQQDPTLQDITRWRREPLSLDIGNLTLDGLPDGLDDFQLPAAEDSSSQHWRLSF